MPTIDTVAALLAKAERTDVAAEAEAYLAKAQHLATLHSIDLTAAATARNARERATVPLQRTVRIGEPRKHANPHLIALFHVIAAANDVVMDIAHNSTYVIVYGLPDDLDTAEAMWLACAPRMVQSAGAWVRSKQWQNDTVVKAQRGRYVRVPATARSAKAAFFAAFAERIATRLAEARREAIVEADLVDAPAVHERGGAELVLIQKSEQVRSFYRETSQARGSWRGYQGAVAARGSASAKAGDAAGRTARLKADPELGQRGQLRDGS